MKAGLLPISASNSTTLLTGVTVRWRGPQTWKKPHLEQAVQIEPA